MNTIQNAKTIYCIGIGGIGMSALAQLLQHEGKYISGEDITASPTTAILQEKGIDVAFGERGSLLAQADCIVFSGAVPASHPARVAAAEQHIIALNYFEALGQYMQLFDIAVAISGTHGKTTTTAMVANMFTEAGFDPTAVVGSLVKEFGNTNARIGGDDKKVIVVEACEHEAHMLHLSPTVIVVNNIEADHLDFYRDIDHITETFQEFVNMLPDRPDAALIVNADDTRALSLATNVKKISVGIETPADLQAFDIGVEQHAQFFTVDNERYVLRIPGLFNVSNALGVIAVAKHFGIAAESVAKALNGFTGTWRRFDHLGQFHDALVISDYAHHPTEIRKTIQATKAFYPNRRVIVVFQPHQRARTKELFGDFVNAFVQADDIILQEIYDVAGREDDSTQALSSRALVDALEQNGQFATYTPNAEASREALEDMVEPNDVVLIMGAGDIHVLAESLVLELNTQ